MGQVSPLDQGVAPVQGPPKHRNVRRVSRLRERGRGDAMFTSRARLIFYCVCLFGSIGGARLLACGNFDQSSAESSLITAVSRTSYAHTKASRRHRVDGADLMCARLRPSRLHHLEYGRFRHHNVSPLFGPIAQDSDDDDDDDDSDLLVPPFVRRHRSVDPRQQSLESMLAGGQSADIARAQAGAPQWHAIGPHTISLESLQIRLQI